MASNSAHDISEAVRTPYYNFSVLRPSNTDRFVAITKPAHPLGAAASALSILEVTDLVVEYASLGSRGQFEAGRTQMLLKLQLVHRHFL